MRNAPRSSLTAPIATGMTKSPRCAVGYSCTDALVTPSPEPRMNTPPSMVAPSPSRISTPVAGAVTFLCTAPKPSDDAPSLTSPGRTNMVKPPSTVAGAMAAGLVTGLPMSWPERWKVASPHRAATWPASGLPSVSTRRPESSAPRSMAKSRTTTAGIASDAMRDPSPDLPLAPMESSPCPMTSICAVIGGSISTRYTPSASTTAVVGASADAIPTEPRIAVTDTVTVVSSGEPSAIVTRPVKTVFPGTAPGAEVSASAAREAARSRGCRFRGVSVEVLTVLMRVCGVSPAVAAAPSEADASGPVSARPPQPARQSIAAAKAAPTEIANQR